MAWWGWDRGLPFSQDHGSDQLECLMYWSVAKIGRTSGDWARRGNLMGVLDRGIKMQIQLTFDKMDSCE